MIFELIILILEKIADLIILVLPSSTFLPLPDAFYTTLTNFGAYVAMGANFLPDGTLTNLLLASGFILAVRLVAVPVMAGQHITIPFGGLFKR
jgi:hypothetical protein